LRWFASGGAFGICVGLALYGAASFPAVRTNGVFNPYILAVFCPGTVLGLIDPNSAAQATVIVLALLTNFLLYGCVGLVARWLIRSFAHRREG
jgi:predicted cobalt transporter CbtA